MLDYRALRFANWAIAWPRSIPVGMNAGPKPS